MNRSLDNGADVQTKRKKRDMKILMSHNDRSSDSSEAKMCHLNQV